MYKLNIDHKKYFFYSPKIGKKKRLGSFCKSSKNI